MAYIKKGQNGISRTHGWPTPITKVPRGQLHM